jgi:hypothetical protein
LVHQFDELEDFERPWLPCPEHGYHNWCHKFSDRWAASILNTQLRVLYYSTSSASNRRDGAGGVVLSPTHTDIFCAYATDGNSMDESKVCHPLGGNGRTCIPGCFLPSQQCKDADHPWTCSFPPARLKVALEAQLSHPDLQARNNEIVVDMTSLVNRMPSAIEAFFLTPLSHGTEREKVLNAWRRFNQEHGAKSEGDAAPLLQLDVSQETNPFSVADHWPPIIDVFYGGG